MASLSIFSLLSLHLLYWKLTLMSFLEKLDLKLTALPLYAGGREEPFEFSYIKYLSITIVIPDPPQYSISPPPTPGVCPDPTITTNENIYRFPTLKCPKLETLVIQSNVHFVFDIHNQILPSLNALSIVSIRRHSDDNREILVDISPLPSLSSLCVFLIKDIEFFTISDMIQLQTSRKSRKSLRVIGPESLNKLIEVRNSPSLICDGKHVYKPSVISSGLETIVFQSTAEPKVNSRILIRGRDNPNHPSNDLISLKKVNIFGFFNSAKFINIPTLEKINFYDCEPMEVKNTNNPRLKHITYTLLFDNSFYCCVTGLHLCFFTALRAVFRFALWIVNIPISIPWYRYRFIPRDDSFKSGPLDHKGWAFQNKTSNDKSFGFNKKRAWIFFILDCLIIYLIFLLVRLGEYLESH